MHYSQITEKVLVPGVNEKLPPLEKTFFFERKDGTIIHAQAAEAWNIYCGRGLGIKGVPPKLIGVSDGSLYREAVKESQQIFKTQGLQAAQERIRRGLQEEIEKARGNIEIPRNTDKMGTGAHLI